MKLCGTMAMAMASISNNIPNTVLVLPLPAQGHVIPMVTFSQKLVEQGCNIIFVNSEFIHHTLLTSIDSNKQSSQIKFVSIPDGLAPEHDRGNFGELFESVSSTMPGMLEKLIKDIALNDGIRIRCVIVDVVMGWGLEVASKLGIRGAMFWPAPAAMFALQISIPKLIDEGIIDSDGLSITKKTFQLSPSIPAMNTRFIWWANMHDHVTEAKAFNNVVHCMPSVNLTEWWLCNSAYELEPALFSFVPKLLPIGPLLQSYDNSGANDDETSLGQFCKEDLSCMSWLHQQAPRSVLYVAFGSTTHFDKKQFKELSLALDLIDKPFLWVVPQGFDCNDAVSFKGNNRGKIIGWAPQQKVLSHPSIACFISHCGWNSTLEGLSNGVPFLCWPYFADQFYLKTFICNELKVGLGFDSDENELVSHWEIKAKVDQLVKDENIVLRSQRLKEKLKKNTEEGGPSWENLNKFVKWLKV